MTAVGRDKLSAFDPGESGRPLRVIFDRSTLDSDGDVELLMELCAENGIDAHSTSPADPVPTLVVGDVGQDDMASVPTERGFDGLIWPVSQIRTRARAQAEQEGADVDAVFAARMLGAASGARDADALVTASPFLLGGQTPREGNALSLAEAFALVGLYLRANDRFTVCRVPGEREVFGHPVVLGWWMTYLVMTREHLPSMWTWSSGCLASDDSLGDMTALGESVIRRVDRTLRVRDRLPPRAQRPQKQRGTVPARRSLVHVERRLRRASRVAHRAYSISGSGGARAGPVTIG